MSLFHSFFLHFLLFLFSLSLSPCSFLKELYFDIQLDKRSKHLSRQVSAGAIQDSNCRKTGTKNNNDKLGKVNMCPSWCLIEWCQLFSVIVWTISAREYRRTQVNWSRKILLIGLAYCFTYSIITSISLFQLLLLLHIVSLSLSLSLHPTLFSKHSLSFWVFLYFIRKWVIYSSHSNLETCNTPLIGHLLLLHA